jgi:pimeloyl-ACP methyl ester carboxylesterase
MISTRAVWLLASLLAGIPALAATEKTDRVNDFGGRRTDFDVDGARGFVIEPTALRADGTKPWIWYAPTIERHPATTLHWLVPKLLAAGFYFCGDNVGETFGNPRSREQFAAFYRHVVGRYGLDRKVCLFPQSRGGLNHYLFAAMHPEWVRCIGGIYPVADLRSYPGLKAAAAAYGTSAADLAAHLPEHNPVDLLAPLARAGIPILHLHGDDDPTVPLARNSAVIFERYRTLGGAMRLIVLHGEGHSESRRFFESEALLQFFVTQGRDVHGCASSVE